MCVSGQQRLFYSETVEKFFPAGVRMIIQSEHENFLRIKRSNSL